MKNKVSVVIPNWNGEHLLKDCLESLKEQSFKHFEIILVDNGSTDNSLEYVAENFPKVKILKLKKNFGFARAINEGVKASKAEYVIFLNNDTSADKEFIKNLVRCADQHQEVISVNPKLLNFYEKQKIDGVGILINEVGQARSIGWEEKDLGQYDPPAGGEEYIFGATGGGSLFKRKEFLKLGGFDENYFMYSEEVDFAFRAQFLGYKSIYCPKAVVFHKHKETAKKLPALVEYWQFRNMTQTIIKDFPTEILFKKWRWLKIFLVHLNTIFYQLKNGYFWPPILADLWILFHLPRLLKERSKIQKNKASLSLRDRKVTDEYIEQFLAPKKITFWSLRT